MRWRQTIRRISRTLRADHAFDAQMYCDIASRDRELVRDVIGRDQGLRVLDVGCGERYPCAIIYSSWGWNVTGIDTERVWRAEPARCLAESLREGPKAFLRRLYHEATIVRPFHRELLKILGMRMPRTLDIRRLGASKLPFADGEFDFVRSIAVLEHIFDLDESLRELARVMKPGGLAIHSIHLFTSLSGGHDSAWDKPDASPPADVRPWEHLRTGRSPSMSILNRKREAEYRECFERYYEVLEWRRTREGEPILTPELRRELSDYSEDELLTRTITVVARRAAL